MPEKTFAMIKPTALQDGHSPAITDRIKKEGFNILAQEQTQLTRKQAEELYAVHKERSFFGEMLGQITAGPVVLMVLEKENAILDWRNLMGATNPADAAENTMRKLYGKNIGENATHGSDSVENARTELGIFFPDLV